MKKLLQILTVLLLCSCTKIGSQAIIEVKALSLHREANALTYELKTTYPVQISVTYVLSEGQTKKDAFVILDTKAILFEDTNITSESYIIINWQDSRGKNELTVW